MTITDELNKISTSTYGRDVRQAIVDAIQLCYDDATGEPEDYSITSVMLAKQRAELIEYGSAILIDDGATPSVIFNSDGSGRVIYAMAGGIARRVVLPDATKPLTISGDPTLTNTVVQYLVVDSVGTPIFRRYSVLADDDFIIGILYGDKISLFDSQDNGVYEPGEVLTNYIKFHRRAKKIFIPKGLQITKDQNSYYVTTTKFFDVSETDVAKYYVIDKITSEASVLSWKDVSIMSQKYVVFGYSYKGQVYVYGQGFIQDAYYMKKGWTTDAKKMIQNSIKNPFVRSNIKLVGDSITAGVGGTGYTQTGTPMFTDTSGKAWSENVETATCWANSFRNMMNDYRGDTYVEPLHKGIYWSTTPTYVTEGSLSQSYMSYKMVNVGDYVAFTFYGDKLNINFSQTGTCGFANIYIDGVLVETFDGYNSVTTWNVLKNVPNLTKAYHSCIIEVDSNRNAASTGNGVYFNGVIVTKEITFKNWGASGQTTQWVFDNLSSIVTSDDDLYFMQIGTNDRKLTSNWVVTSMFERNVVEAMLKQGSDVIIMTANSGQQWNEESVSRLFHSNRVADENMKVAIEYNLPYISNYNAFLDYLLYPNASYDDLMDPDGTHPNDKGHKLMFRNICKETGLNAYIGLV